MSVHRPRRQQSALSSGRLARLGDSRSEADHVNVVDSHTGARTASHAMFVDVCRRKLQSGLCQNCVRYPRKPRSNTVIYGDTPMHIVVAGSRCWRVRWCVSVCVTERERNQFPSVPDRPLQHLSV
jgi:hypothetical protein